MPGQALSNGTLRSGARAPSSSARANSGRQRVQEIPSTFTTFPEGGRPKPPTAASGKSSKPAYKGRDHFLFRESFGPGSAPNNHWHVPRGFDPKRTDSKRTDNTRTAAAAAAAAKHHGLRQGPVGNPAHVLPDTHFSPPRSQARPNRKNEVVGKVFGKDSRYYDNGRDDWADKRAEKERARKPSRGEPPSHRTFSGRERTQSPAGSKHSKSSGLSGWSSFKESLKSALGSTGTKGSGMTREERKRMEKEAEIKAWREAQKAKISRPTNQIPAFEVDRMPGRDRVVIGRINDAQASKLTSHSRNPRTPLPIRKIHPQPTTGQKMRAHVEKAAGALKHKDSDLSSKLDFQCKGPPAPRYRERDCMSCGRPFKPKGSSQTRETSEQTYTERTEASDDEMRQRYPDHPAFRTSSKYTDARLPSDTKTQQRYPDHPAFRSSAPSESRHRPIRLTEQHALPPLSDVSKDKGEVRIHRMASHRVQEHGEVDQHGIAHRKDSQRSHMQRRDSQSSSLYRQPELTKSHYGHDFGNPYAGSIPKTPALPTRSNSNSAYNAAMHSQPSPLQSLERLNASQLTADNLATLDKGRKQLPPAPPVSQAPSHFPDSGYSEGGRDTRFYDFYDQVLPGTPGYSPPRNERKPPGMGKGY